MEIRDIGPGRGPQVMVGTVVKVQGVRGEVKISPAGGRPDDFKLFRRLQFSGKAGDSRSFEIQSLRVQGKAAVVKLAGLDTRDQAENLRGAEVLVDREMLPEPGPGKVYRHDLEGLTVLTAEGRRIGRVSSLLLTSAHHILVIEDGEHEYLVPVRKQFVVTDKLKQGILVVTPPPGLLEMNE